MLKTLSIIYEHLHSEEKNTKGAGFYNNFYNFKGLFLGKEDN